MGLLKLGWILVSIALAYFVYKVLNDSNERTPVFYLGELGVIQGTIQKSRDGKDFSQYLGIPYAQPPIGNLRFEPPLDPVPWKELLFANSYGSECVQLSMITGKPVGSEDCLFLNLFVPNTTAKHLPVMVYIHGGLFYEGSSNFYRPQYFMDHEIILVTMNYRLSALGFLNTGDGVIRGNMGLKDQNMALKWVQKFIKYFNGDPKRVVLFGESAGGASVHYHMMSPMSQGLFYKAISQSGTAFQPRAYFDGDTAEQAKRLAGQLNCPLNKMIDCLKSVPAHTFVEVQEADIKNALREKNSLYLPTKENVLDSNTFLANHPLNTVQNLKSVVPWITGINSQEGLLVEALLVRNETLRQTLKEDWITNMPYFLHMNPKYNIPIEKIKEFYFKEKSQLNFEVASENYTSLLSDRFFLYGFHQAVILHVQKSLSPTYTYYFQHEGDFSLYTFLTALKGKYHPMIEVILHLAKSWVNRIFYGIQPPKKGVCHADELQYFFHLDKMNVITEGHSDYEFSKELVRLWTSFAKNEDLQFNGVKWDPVEKSSINNLPFLAIDKKAEVIKEPFQERMHFWDGIKEYYWGQK